MALHDYHTSGGRYTFPEQGAGDSCQAVFWDKKLGCLKWKYSASNKEEGTDQTGLSCRVLLFYLVSLSFCQMFNNLLYLCCRNENVNTSQSGH